METFSIETDGAGGFHVRSTMEGETEGRVIGGFPTLRQAEDWINERIQAAIRSTNASDVA